jgi:VCBS repeat protein
MRFRMRKILASVTLLALGLGGSACEKDPPSPPAQQGLVAMSDGLPGDELWRQDFTFADMDGDGTRDLVTAPPRKSKEPWPHIFLRRQARWEPVSCPGVGQNGFPQQEYVYGGVAVADFSGAGKLEIAIAMHETGIRIFSNAGAGPCGPWEERKDLPKGMLEMRTRAIAVADMNRDGRTDLVAVAEAPNREMADNTAGVTIFLNEPGGWRPQVVTGSEGLFGDDVTTGEINGDGIPDVAVGSLNDRRPQFAWLSDGKGGWRAAGAEGLAPNIIAWSVQLADFDGDGKDELLLGVGGAPIHQNGGPRVYRWDGARWQDDSKGLPQVSWVCGVTALDLDRDGKKEIVSAGMYTGTVQVYSRRPDGTWEERQNLQAATEQQKLRNYKIRGSGDGKKEDSLVVANYAGEGGGKMLAWVWQ